MSPFFWNGLSVLLNGFFWTLLLFLFRKEEARLPRKGVYALCALIEVAAILGYPLYARQVSWAVEDITGYLGILWLLSLPVALWVYPHNGYKNLFLTCSAANVIVIGTGFGKLAELSSHMGMPVNLSVRLAVDALMVLAIVMIYRKFPHLHAEGDRKTWRLLWLIAMLLGFIQLFTTGYMDESTVGAPNFLPIRLCLSIAMIAIFYIAGLAQRQAQEAAELESRAAVAANTFAAKDERYARIVENVEEANRLRHDLRQIFATMQGLNQPGQETELAAYCEEVLAQFARAEQEGEHGTS